MKKIIIFAAFLASLVLMNSRDQYMIHIGIQKMPDMMIGFNIYELQNTFNNIRDKAQFTYLQYLCIDCFFTILFALIQNGILRYVLQTSEVFQRYHWTYGFAQMRAGFDIFENGIFALLLFNQITHLSFVYILAELVTSIKFLMYGMWILSVVILFFTRILINLKGELR